MSAMISFNGVIHSKPKVIFKDNLDACLFSVKSGTDIYYVAAPFEAYHDFHKGDNVYVEGYYSPKNAMVGVTELTKVNTPDTIIRGNIPADILPQQTRRKPNKSGLFDVPKSAAIISSKQDKKPVFTPAVDNVPTNTENVSITDKEITPTVSTNNSETPKVKVSNGEEKKSTQTHSATVKVPDKDSKTETNPCSDAETDKIPNTEASINGLPLPTAFFSTPSTEIKTPSSNKNVTEHLSTPVATPVEEQSTNRWSNADFDM